MSFEYTGCKEAVVPTEAPNVNFVSSSSVGYPNPMYIISDAKVTISPVTEGPGVAAHDFNVKRCTVNITIPADFQPPVMLYYKLTNFYQNHRKYTKSLDYKQLSGVAATVEEINGRKGCVITDNVLIYPCGLIANSMFDGKTSQEPELVAHLNYMLVLFGFQMIHTLDT
jgi:hypothetical protein